VPFVPLCGHSPFCYRIKRQYRRSAKLETLFKETENFWTPFKTRDALDFARNAQTGLQAVNVAARDNNGQKAQAAYNAIGKSCKGCHDSHRESTPDKSFRIKP